MNKNIIGVLVGILILGGLIWIARPNSQTGQLAAVGNGGTLMAVGANNYDFGTISMAAGKVKYTFKIKNTGSEITTVNKIYTSCMCTEASLLADGQLFGPFGMPGHAAIPKINAPINPGEEATVEVVFDPAAHGPAGVGRIGRVVTVENSAGQPVELEFTAVVTP